MFYRIHIIRVTSTSRRDPSTALIAALKVRIPWSVRHGRKREVLLSKELEVGFARFDILDWPDVAKFRLVGK